MSNSRIHVVPHDGDWAVKREGTSRASSVHRTQADAIDQGRDQAKAARTELVIHDRQGQVRDADSYGNDPCPPKDKKH